MMRNAEAQCPHMFEVSLINIQLLILRKELRHLITLCKTTRNSSDQSKVIGSQFFTALNLSYFTRSLLTDCLQNLFNINNS